MSLFHELASQSLNEAANPAMRRRGIFRAGETNMQSRSLAPGLEDSRTIEVAFDRDVAILSGHELAGLDMPDDPIAGVFQKPDYILDLSFLLGHGLTVHFEIEGRAEAAQKGVCAFESL